MDLTETLSAHPDLGRLSPGDRRQLESAFTVETHPDGTVFVSEGEKPGAAWLILEGRVAVTRVRDPYVDELASLGPGEAFGLASLVSGMRRTATCLADGEVTAARIDAATLDALMRDAAPIGLAVQRAVMRQLASDARIISRELHEVLGKIG